MDLHGKPQALRLDDGTELTSIAFTEWCHGQGIELRFIQPGKPGQNAFIERFNKTDREEVLSAYVFPGDYELTPTRGKSTSELCA